MSSEKNGLERSIRGSQLISPYGACAIYDFGNESFVIKSTESWPQRASQNIRLRRLEDALRVSYFKQPLVKIEKDVRNGRNKTNSFEMMRFPSWLFCPSCRKMQKWQYEMEETGKPPECRKCAAKSRLAPMRFVSVCPNGHLSDVAWGWWAHSESDKKCTEKEDFSFIDEYGVGGSLASLAVKCNKCNSSRNLADLTRPNALGKRCTGKHPWQGGVDAESCSESMVVLQRGASNVYYSEVEMALDISLGEANYSDVQKRITGNNNWRRLVEVDKKGDQILFEALVGWIADEESCKADDIENLLRDGDSNYDVATGSLKQEEWMALNINKDSPVKRGRSFSARVVDISKNGSKTKSHDQFLKLVSKVVLVDQLRIVKANSGFRRVNSDGRMVSPNLQQRSDWLPAIEIFGEGVFIALDEEAVQLWEKALPNNSIHKLKEAHGNSFLKDRLDEPTPRYLLVHTLAHLLIRQLCFECGYSASSLAERIYVEEGKMAGMLIYTASGDSEGALGGLARQGEVDRFHPMFQSALLRGQWCSADPVCGESKAQGYEGLNQAACHACALVSETSCESMNVLLDRNMLFGGPEFPGFFEELTRLIETEIV